MADVAPTPFINFGLSQAQQAQATAGANATQQQANLTSQQAQQAQMQTALMQRAMPLYQQTIDDMKSDMSGTSAGNAMTPTGEQAQTQADTSGAAPPPAYADPGAIAEKARQDNFVQPVTPQEQKALLNGAIFAGMPGGSPAYLNAAKMQQQFRVKNQMAANQYRSGQLYDVMTAVQDPDNQDPLGMLRATPGQQAVVAQIVQDHPGDEAGQEAAARLYAQRTAFNLHQYTGRSQSMQNGVLVDTTVGAPVTGQDQVLTGLTPEQRSKAMQYANEQIPVVLNTGDKTEMPRWKAPVSQGGLGMSPEAYVARQDTVARAHLQDPTTPAPGANSWDSDDAVGNNAGASDAKNGNAPAAAPPSKMAPGVRPAVGAKLAQVQGATAPTSAQSVTNNVPSPTTALKGPVPPTGTPAYNSRLGAALADPTYKAQWNVTPKPGLPMPGASTGITDYQNNRVALLKESGENAQSADQALQNFQAAKAIFDSNAPMTGPLGALEQKVAASLGLDWRSPAARQEVAKYLINGAISGLKQTYGARPGVFDVKINVEQAFPNIDKMSPPAIRNLIDSQITQAQYIKDSAVRAKAYANRGLEPTSFSTWNSTYFPRSELLDNQYGNNPKQPPQGAETRDYQGASYYLTPGADRTKQANWVMYKKAAAGG